MNPILQLPVLIPLAAGIVVLTVIGAWRCSAGLSRGTRFLLGALRLLAVALLVAIAFNPGKWVRPAKESIRPWLILTDVSASMARADGESKTRASEAADLTTQAAAHSKSADVPLKLFTFAENPTPAADSGPPQPSNGTATRILPSISKTLQDAASAGEALAGVIVISDGRETLEFSQAELDALSLRARSRNVAIHTVAIGAGTPPPDLKLSGGPATLTAFPGQPLRVPFALEATGLDPLHAKVTLRDASGAEIANLTAEVPPGKPATGIFEIKAPTTSARWSIETPVLPAEVRQANNRIAFNIRVIESKTRIFLAEGAPYWDSKFLAQLLRQQPQMEVQSVHRLSDMRYFRIDSGSAEPAEADRAVFPASADELSHYDLIIFGKNIDPFLTNERAEALRTYVRDRGGALLFSRGKPTTGEAAALEPLEPVVWAAATSSDFRFVPTRDGEAAGLFGQALPAPDASLWNSLPTLKDGRQISMVKPFTRVLAEGRPEGSAAMSGKFPALLVRRYGQGVVGLVNGDGLWKWDFYPEARELGNCYEDFWTQLIQWMASYSEFLPGQDFSLRLPSTRGQSGVPIAATMSFRGSGAAPQPELLLTSPGGIESRLRPANLTDPSGRPSWRASFTPDTAGDWKLKLIDPRPKAPPSPEAMLSVPAAPKESDDLSPDPAYLAAISTATGGRSLMPADFAAFLAKNVVASSPARQESGAVWQAAWNKAWIALLIALLLAAEWFLRRREGLA